MFTFILALMGCCKSRHEADDGTGLTSEGLRFGALTFYLNSKNMKDIVVDHKMHKYREEERAELGKC